MLWKYGGNIPAHSSCIVDVPSTTICFNGFPLNSYIASGICGGRWLWMVFHAADFYYFLTLLSSIADWYVSWFTRLSGICRCRDNPIHNIIYMADSLLMDKAACASAHGSYKIVRFITDARHQHDDQQHHHRQKQQHCCRFDRFEWMREWHLE